MLVGGWKKGLKKCVLSFNSSDTEDCMLKLLVGKKVNVLLCAILSLNCLSRFLILKLAVIPLSFSQKDVVQKNGSKLHDRILL